MGGGTIFRRMTDNVVSPPNMLSSHRFLYRLPPVEKENKNSTAPDVSVYNRPMVGQIHHEQDALETLPSQTLVPFSKTLPVNRKKSFQKESYRKLPSGASEKADDVDHFLFHSIEKFYHFYARYVAISTHIISKKPNQLSTDIACVVVDGMQITGEQFHCSIKHQYNPSAFDHIKERQDIQSMIIFLDMFLKNSPLVFQNKNLDLQRIIDRYRAENIETKFGSRNLFIDTLALTGESSLNTKGHNENNICETEDHHNNQECNTLGDALVTAQNFCEFFCHNQNLFSNTSYFPNVDVFNRFGKINDTKKISIYSKMGIELPLPENFLYSSHLYHPQLNTFFLASIIPFYTIQNYIVGYFVRYFMKPTTSITVDEKKQNVFTHYFYGQHKTSFAKILDAKKKETTVFVGKIKHALLLRDIVCGKEETTILDNLNIHPDEFSIKGVLSSSCFETMPLDPKTRQIIFLFDNVSVGNTLFQERLSRIIEHFNQNIFLRYYKAIAQKNLINWQIKYKQVYWQVIDDYTKNKTRFLEIKSDFNEKSIISFIPYQKKVYLNNVAIFYPNKDLQFFEPKITFRCVPIRTKDLVSYFTKEQINQEIQDTLEQSIPILNFKDFMAIEKIKEALHVYNSSLEIDDESIVKEYCKTRGIQFPLPKTFRYKPHYYHNWIRALYPVIIVPLFNKDNKIDGIHRIFFDYNGAGLPKTSENGEKIPTKVSLGKAVARANEIYKTSINHETVVHDNDQAEVVMISEGFENGLIIRDTFNHFINNDATYALKLFKHFGITNIFSIKGCIGINGFIDVPLYDKTTTVVLLADNDGLNKDAKMVLNNAIEKFLMFNKKVYLVFPEGSDGEKIDINDVFLREKKFPYNSIGNMLLKSVQIYEAHQLGDKMQSMQNVFLNMQKRNHILDNQDDTTQTIEDDLTDNTSEDGLEEVTAQTDAGALEIDTKQIIEDDLTDNTSEDGLEEVTAQTDTGDLEIDTTQTIEHDLIDNTSEDGLEDVTDQIDAGDLEIDTKQTIEDDFAEKKKTYDPLKSDTSLVMNYLANEVDFMSKGHIKKRLKKLF